MRHSALPLVSSQWKMKFVPNFSFSKNTYVSNCTEDYRYQFNGKEKDSETELQDYGMRIYNERLGRFLSVDPLTKDYAELTPYQFASNTPICAIDLDGKEMYYAADGTLLGQIGSSTRVRVVSQTDVGKVTTYINTANSSSTSAQAKEQAASQANGVSKDVGMTNDELKMRAFLSVIQQGEAGLGEDRYRTRFGGSTFDDYSTHPGTIIIGGDNYSAAGAYGIIKAGYDEDKMKDFTPESQDRWAVNKIIKKGAYDEIMRGDFTEACSILNGTWSSLPGGIDGGQKRTVADVENSYKKFIIAELHGDSYIQTKPGDLIPAPSTPNNSTPNNSRPEDEMPPPPAE
jgi:RHS repeat-associated protein